MDKETTQTLLDNNDIKNDYIIPNKNDSDVFKVGYFFERIIDFIKMKIITTLSIVFVGYTILENDKSNKHMVKNLVKTLLFLAVVIYVAGVFDLIMKIYRFKVKLKSLTWKIIQWFIIFLCAVIYITILIFLYLFIKLQIQTIDIQTHQKQ